jgi:glucoamylase
MDYFRAGFWPAVFTKSMLCGKPSQRALPGQPADRVLPGQRHKEDVMRGTQRSTVMARHTRTRNKAEDRGQRLRWASLPAAAAVLAGLSVFGPATPALAQGSAPGAPGANATWNESNVQGFADSLGSASKVWYTLGNGELENVFYPQTDTPDTFGLQYIVTDGSAFTATETANTSHVISLADSTSLVWQQVNTAANGDFKITKTYIADPSRSVVLIQTTFDNLSSTPLQLYADYLPQLNNDGMGNTGGTDSASGDLVSSNGPVSSALASAGQVAG